jgi:hypothetical protein
MKGVRTAVGALVATALLSSGEASAWVYPEHRDITLQAVQGLEPARRATLDGLWSAARHGHEQRLCEAAADAAQLGRPSCLDWAAWPAIAGDHSCSGTDLLAIVTQSTWILDVARVGARLRERLARNAKPASLVNALRSSDVQLLRADPQYVTRASSNNVHFLLARPGPDTTPAAYLKLVLAPGADPNAIGAYVFYHLAALRSARASPGRTPIGGPARLVRRSPTRRSLFTSSRTHLPRDTWRATGGRKPCERAPTTTTTSAASRR